MTATDHPLFPGGSAPRAVALAGDWHGNSTRGRVVIEKAAAAGADLVIELGDFGWWTPGRETDRYIGALDRALTFHGLTLLWLDGNHEDFDSLYEIPIDPGTGLRKITDRIWHLPRGYRWVWAEQVWMALGGAVSVDKGGRTSGVDWWPHETLTAADLHRATADGRVDVMLTHDAPAGVVIPGIDDRAGNGGWPADVIAEANTHRELLRGVVDLVHPARLWHGHYHVRYDGQLVSAAESTTKVGGLAHDVGRWEDNVALVDTRGEQVRLGAVDA